mgnify:CR=1 FL=1
MVLSKMFVGLVYNSKLKCGVKMSRRYNKSTYAKFKKFNGVIRDNCSPNPTEALNFFGVIGKVFGSIINYIIAKPIHFIAFALTGLFYNKRKDKPYKGSIIYTIVFIAVMAFVGGMISCLIDIIH